MIPYDDLLMALVGWRRRQGLAVSARFSHVAAALVPAPDPYAADAPTNFAAPAYHPPISPASRRTSSFSAVNVEAPVDPDGITLMSDNGADLVEPPAAAPPAAFTPHERTLAFGVPVLPRAGTQNIEEDDIVAQASATHHGHDLSEDPDATVAGEVTAAQLDALKLQK